MSRDTTAPAGNGGLRKAISSRNSTPKLLSALLTEIPAIAPHTQETQEHQERQDTQRVTTSQRGRRSYVSCVSPEEKEGSTRSPVSQERDEEDHSCASCVKEQGRVVESEFQKRLKRAAERSTEDLLKHRGSPRPKDFRSPSLLFARCLKADPTLSGLDAEAATERIDQELDVMYPEHLAPWVALGLQDFDSRDQVCDPRSDFLTVWERITTPFQPGGPVHEAARAAEEKPLDLGNKFSRPPDALFRKFLSLCYWLGESSREGVFFLSCRDIGDVLNVSPITASQLCQRAQAAGFLEPVGSYTKKDRARRRAKSWRFKPPSPLLFLT